MCICLYILFLWRLGGDVKYFVIGDLGGSKLCEIGVGDYIWVG